MKKLKEFFEKNKRLVLIFAAGVLAALAIFGLIALFNSRRVGEKVVNEEEYIEGPELEAFYDENPILKVLPIKIDYFTKNYAKRVRYTISYQLAEDLSGFKILITDYTGGNYEDALSKIRARGFSPEDYEILYFEEIDNTGKASD